VIGRVIPSSLLLSLAARTDEWEDEALSALEAMCAAGLLAEQDSDFEFTHDLIREVVLADLSSARRRVLHRRVGEALARLPAGLRERHLGEITHHFLEAGEGTLALPYALQAGDRALRVYAYDEAERHYRLAVALSITCSDEARRAEALEALGKVLRLQGRHDAALEALQAAGETYEATGMVEGIGRIIMQMAWVHLGRGSPEQGIASLGPVVGLLRARGLAPDRLTDVYLAMAQLYIQTGRLVELTTVAEQALVLAQSDDAEAARQEVTSVLDLARALQGQADHMDSFANRAPAVEETGDPEETCRTLLIHAYVCEIGGASARAEEYIASAMTIAERSSIPDLMAACLGQRGHHRLECGQWGKAREDFARMEMLARESSASWWLPVMRVHLGYLCLIQGDTAAGLRLLTDTIATSERTNNFFASNWARYRLAEWDLVGGRANDARARLASIVEAEERRNAPSMVSATYAWALLELGEVAAAESLIGRALAVLTTGDLHSRTTALRIQTMVFTRQRLWDEAQTTVESGLALARSLRYPYGEARTLYIAGLLHRDKGVLELAREHFEQALDICDQLGEGLYRPHIARALAEVVSGEVARDA
jgi:tetratricopeptide (TPR) repeat protein